MRKLICASVLAGFLDLLGVSLGLATPVSLELVPSSLIVFPGQAVTVDIIIAGVVAGGPPSVGAFDLDVSFDPAILAPTGVVFGPFLGDPDLSEALTDSKFLLGIVNVAEVSLLPPAALDALQPGSFSLATLSFVALASGTSVATSGNGVETSVAISGGVVDDAFGAKLVVIPEPATILLLGSGLAGLGGLAWKRNRPRSRRHSAVSPDGEVTRACKYPGAVGLTR